MNGRPVTANVGDKVWFYGPLAQAGSNPICMGTVEHTFMLWGDTQYVISFETSIDPTLYVRDGWSMTDDPDKPIGLYRR